MFSLWHQHMEWKAWEKKEIKGSVHCFLLSVSTLVALISSHRICPVLPDTFVISGVEPKHSNLGTEVPSPSQSSTHSYLRNKAQAVSHFSQSL